MVSVEQIGWGVYSGYEGPSFHGSQRYVLPAEPTKADKQIAVITAAEGGTYDGINMYDSGIISVGLIQWIESGQHSVSSMLGKVAELNGIDFVVSCLGPALALSNARFQKNSRGKWRFFFNDERGEVDTQDKQRQLFLGCSGKLGAWTPEARLLAKTWAACVASVWSDEGAKRAQVSYTADRLMGFVLPFGKAELFDQEPDEGWVAATRAVFVSFAVNLPAAAEAQLKAAINQLKSPKWSPSWCIGLIKQLTFGPKIRIYPQRYNNIRPTVERLWGIQLPKTADSLAIWNEPEPVVEHAPGPTQASQDAPERPSNGPQAAQEGSENPGQVDLPFQDKGLVLSPVGDVSSATSKANFWNVITQIINAIVRFFVRAK